MSGCLQVEFSGRIFWEGMPLPLSGTCQCESWGQGQLEPLVMTARRTNKQPACAAVSVGPPAWWQVLTFPTVQTEFTAPTYPPQWPAEHQAVDSQDSANTEIFTQSTCIKHLKMTNLIKEHQKIQQKNLYLRKSSYWFNQNRNFKIQSFNIIREREDQASIQQMRRDGYESRAIKCEKKQ